MKTIGIIGYVLGYIVGYILGLGVFKPPQRNVETLGPSKRTGVGAACGHPCDVSYTLNSLLGRGGGGDIGDSLGFRV